MAPLRANTGSDSLFTVMVRGPWDQLIGFQIGPVAARKVDAALVAGFVERRDQHLVAQQEFVGVECALAVVGYLQGQGMPDREAAILQLGDVAAEERIELLAEAAEPDGPRRHARHQRPELPRPRLQFGRAPCCMPPG